VRIRGTLSDRVVIDYPPSAENTLMCEYPEPRQWTWRFFQFDVRWNGLVDLVLAGKIESYTNRSGIIHGVSHWQCWSLGIIQELCRREHSSDSICRLVCSQRCLGTAQNAHFRGCGRSDNEHILESWWKVSESQNRVMWCLV